MIRRELLGLTAALILFLGGCAHEPDRRPAPLKEDVLGEALLGVTWREGRGELVELDPLTLSPISARGAPVGAQPVAVSAFSPDGSRLAVGDMSSPLVRLVDVERMRPFEPLKLPRRLGAATELAWPEPSRLIVLVHGTDPRVLVADLVERDLFAMHRLGGEPVASRETDTGLALLLAPRAGIGSARLALASADGSVHSLALPGIQAGWEGPSGTAGQATIGRHEAPALAVDLAGKRAFVVPPGNRIVEVDLRSFAVTSRELTEPVSLLERLRAWLDPVAEAKGPSEGSLREAHWLGGGLLAVSGSDTDAWLDADGNVRQRIEPAGLRLIDTRRWTVRTLGEKVSSVSFARAAGVLLAHGTTWDPSGEASSIGLVAYGLDGRERFRLFGGEPVFDLHTAGSYAYVGVGDGDSPKVAIVDLLSGRVVRENLPWANLIAHPGA
jgi:hypothetical protein